MTRRILIVMPNMRISNGVTSFIMNCYDYLLDNKYVIDFLVLKKIDSPHNEYVESKGSQIFIYPCHNKYSVDNYKYVRNVVKINHYDYIHINTTGMYAYWALLAAQKAGINYRIYHTHNPKELTSIKGAVREYLFDFLCFRHSTHFFACTKHAGQSVFGNREFSVVRNGIVYDKYKFDADVRRTIRNRLNLDDKIVIGTVCRQADQKNPFFLVDIIKQLVEINEDYVLLWIGTGGLLDDIKKYVSGLKLEDHVIFLGDCNNVCDYYNAMDCFLLPSKYEGLGIVYIEAQVNGLITIASNKVPYETHISSNIHYLQLNDSANTWAKKINLQIQNQKGLERQINKIQELDFSNDVSYTAVQLIEAYNSLEENRSC